LRDRSGEVLFIDARKLGVMVDRVHRELTDEDIAKIADTYHAWRGDAITPSPSMGEGGDEGELIYQDIPGFCKAAALDDIRAHGRVLTPGRYVGTAVQDEDDEPFAEKMARLTKTLKDQFTESARLERAIRENLKRLGYG
jgi:Type I restriction-modification system methyltransferase subunit